MDLLLPSPSDFAIRVTTLSYLHSFSPFLLPVFWKTLFWTIFSLEEMASSLLLFSHHSHPICYLSFTAKLYIVYAPICMCSNSHSHPSQPQVSVASIPTILVRGYHQNLTGSKVCMVLQSSSLSSEILVTDNSFLEISSLLISISPETSFNFSYCLLFLCPHFIY